MSAVLTDGFTVRSMVYVSVYLCIGHDHVPYITAEPGMSNLQYEARLKALSNTSLEQRRIRNDLITCYKYLNNLCEI